MSGCVRIIGSCNKVQGPDQIQGNPANENKQQIKIVWFEFFVFYLLVVFTSPYLYLNKRDCTCEKPHIKWTEVGVSIVKKCFFLAEHRALQAMPCVKLWTFLQFFLLFPGLLAEYSLHREPRINQSKFFLFSLSPYIKKYVVHSILFLVFSLCSYVGTHLPTSLSIIINYTSSLLPWS